MSAAPVPELIYRQPSWGRWGGDDVIGEGPPLADVFQVTVHAMSGDMYARGRMRCRNGLPGPSRGRRVDCNATQPEWLRAIIDDALIRLSANGRRPSDG